MNVERTKQELIHKNERVYFVCALLVSIIVYILLLFSVIGIIYLLLIIGITSFIHLLMLGQIRTNGVKLSSEQFPEVYTR